MVHEDRTWVILGREQFAKGWAGSLRWSEFGGQSKADDGPEPTVTAAREFFEETMGIFGDRIDDLRSDRYNFRVVIKRSSRRHRCTKVLYVLQVPWQPDAAQVFHGRREHLKHILFTVARIRAIQRRLSAAGQPVPDYPSRVAGRLVLVTDLHSVEERSDGSYAIVLSTCRTSGPSYFRIPQLEESRSQGKPRSHEEIVIHKATLPIDQAHVDLYAQMITLKSWLDKLIATFPASIRNQAITYRMNGTLCAWLPFIRKDFLEKDEIRLWSIEELQSSLKTPSQMRSSFLVPLKLVLQQLSRREN